MTELGLTPSQTVGPYLRIGLLRTLVTTPRRRPGATRGRSASRPPARRRGRRRARRHGRDLAGECGRPLPASGRRRRGRAARGRVPRLRPLRHRGRTAGSSSSTVKPGPVPWPEGGLQAPHLDVGVFARGLLKHVVTRLYFPDEEEANAADPVLSRLSADAARDARRRRRGRRRSASTSASRAPGRRHSSRCDARSTPLFVPGTLARGRLGSGVARRRCSTPSARSRSAGAAAGVVPAGGGGGDRASRAPPSATTGTQLLAEAGGAGNPAEPLVRALVARVGEDARAVGALRARRART